jgi:hypothetical protein
MDHAMVGICVVQKVNIGDIKRGVWDEVILVLNCGDVLLVKRLHSLLDATRFYLCKSEIDPPKLDDISYAQRLLLLSTGHFP